MRLSNSTVQLIAEETGNWSLARACLDPRDKASVSRGAIVGIGFPRDYRVAAEEWELDELERVDGCIIRII
jgi:hypothetical protein